MTNWNDLPHREKRPRRLDDSWDSNPRRLMDWYPADGSLDSQALRDAIASYTLRSKPNLWVILSYQHPWDAIHPDFISAHSRVMRFLDRICRKAYGKKGARTLARPRVIGFLEHVQTNKHYNLLICADRAVEGALLDYGDELWRKLAPRSAGFWMTDIDDSRKVINYCNKEQESLGPYGTIFEYGSKTNCVK